MELSFLELAFYTLFTFSVLNTLMYYTYLWQWAEYRIDRMYDTLMTPSGRGKIFPAFYVMQVIFFLLALCTYVFRDNRESFIFFGILAFAFTFIETVLRAFAHHLYRPKPTFKALALMSTTLGIVALLTVVIFIYADLTTMRALLFFLLSLLVSDIHSLVVLAFEPLSRTLKAKIIARAKKKVASMPHLKVIGITGSYGKSSTKEFLSQILSHKYNVFKTPGNTNVDIGVAEVVLKGLRDEHEMAIIEMGAYKKGEIKAICDIVRPEIGIITAVSDQHLSLFGSLEHIKEAKYELIQSLPAGGKAFFNADSEGARELGERAQREGYEVKTYAMKETANFMALHIEVKPDSVTFDIHGVKFRVALCGRQHVANLLGAILLARECGMNLKEISKAVSGITPPSRIMELKSSKSYGDALLVIDDSYNSNPEGAQAAIEHLSLFDGYKKICVFPGMRELGVKSDIEHIRVGEKIRDVCDFTIFTLEDYLEPLKIGLGKQYDESKYAVVTSSEDDIYRMLLEVIGEEKAVVLFESRGATAAMNKLLS